MVIYPASQVASVVSTRVRIPLTNLRVTSSSMWLLLLLSWYGNVRATRLPLRPTGSEPGIRLFALVIRRLLVFRLDYGGGCIEPAITVRLGGKFCPGQYNH